MKARSTQPSDRREQALRSPIFMKQRGSAEWCYQKVAFLRDLMRMEESTVKQFDDAVEDLKTFRAWEKIPEDHPYGSLQALLKAEVGVDSEEAGRNTIRERVKVAADNTDGMVRPRGNHRNTKFGISPRKDRAKVNGVSHETQRKLDRLAREFPEICRLVADGSLTVAAAERAAKIETKPSPLQLVQRAWKKASQKDKQEIVAWLQDQLQTDTELLESL